VTIDDIKCVYKVCRTDVAGRKSLDDCVMVTSYNILRFALKAEMVGCVGTGQLA